MKKSSVFVLHRVYHIAVTISILLAGLCLAAGCLYIFASGGEHPYSPQRVGEVFRQIAIPVLVCPGMILLGFLLEGLAPSPKKPQAGNLSDGLMQSRIDSADLSQADAHILEQINTEKLGRKKRRSTCLLLAGASSLVAIGLAILLYMLFPASKDTNLFVILSFLGTFSVLSVPFGYQIYRSFADSRSLKKEFELIHSLKRKACVADPQACKMVYAQVSLLLAAAISLTVGALMGGTADVLTKAANICTECIGLG